MKRGEVYEARLEPVEGSEQGGTRPVVIVSRDAINAYSPVILAVKCTTYQTGKRVYPTQVLIQSPDGGLTKDSIAMSDQVRVLSKTRMTAFTRKAERASNDFIKSSFIDCVRFARWGLN